jgi:hypothetical protein
MFAVMTPSSLAKIRVSKMNHGGIRLGGVATFLSAAAPSKVSLFIRAPGHNSAATDEGYTQRNPFRARGLSALAREFAGLALRRAPPPRVRSRSSGHDS